jgi:hypothetical protein
MSRMRLVTCYEIDTPCLIPLLLSILILLPRINLVLLSR